MKYSKIKEGIFLSRPNRFIAKVLIEGREETAHVKNTGRCRELLQSGATIYLEDHEGDMRSRKTRFSLVAVEKGVRLVNMDSQAPNKVVAEGLASGTIVLPEFEEGLTYIKSESSFADSRFDFYVEGRNGRRGYIEVKGVTLEDQDTVRFPDAPTERGVKHIKELCKARKEGFLSYVIFVVQMKDVSFFEPNDETHYAFGEALREAASKGVYVLAYDCLVGKDSMEIKDRIEVRL